KRRKARVSWGAPRASTKGRRKSWRRMFSQSRTLIRRFAPPSPAGGRRDSPPLPLAGEGRGEGESSMKSVVVTGASTGIGWGCVKVLVAGGYRVFGSVRRNEDVERLSKEFGEAFRPLIFDVTDRKAVSAATEEVRAALGREALAGLV